MSKNTKSKREAESNAKKMSRKERKNLEYVKYAKERKEIAEWEKEDANNFGFESQKEAPTATKTSTVTADKKKKGKKDKKTTDKTVKGHEVRNYFCIFNPRQTSSDFLKDSNNFHRMLRPRVLRSMLKRSLLLLS